MELIKGLLALAVVLGVPFLVIGAISFVIVCLIALVSKKIDPYGDKLNIYDYKWEDSKKK